MFGIVLSLLGAFTGLSVHGAVGVRYFQLEKKELAEYVGVCVGILVVSTSVVFMLVTIFGSWLTEVSGVPVRWLLIAAVLSGMQFIFNIRLSLLHVAGQAKQYGAFQILQSLCNAGFSLVFILVAGMAWQGRVSGQALAIGIFGFFSLWRLFKDDLLKMPSAWRSQATDALAFGVPLIPHAIGGFVVATGGQFVVTNMLGVSETGIYVVGAQFGLVLGLVADAFVKSYGPWLYEKLKEDSLANSHLVVGATYCAFLFFLGFSIIAAAIIYVVFPFIVGERFMPARVLMVFFVFGQGFVGMYYAVAGFFFFTSKTKFVSIVTIVSGVTAIPVMWAMAGVLGVTGVAFGYLISQIVAFLLAWMISNYIHPMPWLKVNLAFAALSSARLNR